MTAVAVGSVQQPMATPNRDDEDVTSGTRSRATVARKASSVGAVSYKAYRGAARSRHLYFNQPFPRANKISLALLIAHNEPALIKFMFARLEAGEPPLPPPCTWIGGITPFALQSRFPAWRPFFPRHRVARYSERCHCERGE
ncbi:unnamed protein product, partial [Iphiclides podalirius]